jgi:hypothetical protein
MIRDNSHTRKFNLVMIAAMTGEEIMCESESEKQLLLEYAEKCGVTIKTPTIRENSK